MDDDFITLDIKLRERKSMVAYIEIVASVCSWRIDLHDNDLREIGEFTRENVSHWLHNIKFEPGCLKKSNFEVGVYGCQDFHAVYGDIDIPWATEQARKVWKGLE